MKSQKHNLGELKELKISIEKDLVEAIHSMSKNSGMSVEEIVCIALKRFKASHADYEGTTPRTE